MAESVVVARNFTPDYCTPGLLLPLLDEGSWNRPLRAFIYLLALLYAFVGVSVVTDIFMSSVVSITSKTRKVYLAKTKKNGSYNSVGGVVAGIRDDQPEVVEVRVWNDTVANLTLMALGTSAPEILLALIEIIGHNFTSGDLGPGTIVGSAAFNLLVITAVCLVSIPPGEGRRIRLFKVFLLSATFSVLAYIWLFFIVSIWTPNVVDLWEAIVTFLLFPILVGSAYGVDKGLCGLKTFQRSKNKRQMELGTIRPGDENEKMIIEKQFFKDGKLDKDNLVAFVREVKKFPGLSDEDAALLAASKIADSQPHSRIHYRIGAVRDMTGGRKLTPQLSLKLKEVYDAINEHPQAPNLGPVPENKVDSHAVVEFHSATCAVRENIGSFPVTIWRHGNLDPMVKIRVESLDGSAKSKEDYIPVDEILTFESGERQKKLTVRIVDDNKWEPEEEFFLKISLLSVEDDELIQLGRISVMEITILDDDNPGLITFEKRGTLVKESAGNADLHVVRRGGSDGEVTVQWRTIDETAISGRDYIGGSGELTFGHLEVRQTLSIPIIDDLRAERDEHFEVELIAATGGARVGNINRVAVTITNDDAFNNMMEKMLVMTNTNVDALAVHRNSWLEQMKDALSVNGGDLANATCVDYILHLLAFNWKVFFSLIPPPGLLGGWLCFVVSLFAVGLVTAIIGDIASIFGCVVGLKDSITAITLVALGTSLPDTFASRTAAVKEQYADNSVGNITGSNSVNVFLGLGLPWMVAAIYHAAKGTQFIVPAGSLGFSVVLFTICAVLALSLLMVRRNVTAMGSSELGGPPLWRGLSASFLVVLWVLYITLSCLHEYHIIRVNF